MTIRNARDKSLSQSTGTLPDVSGAMSNWFNPMTFFIITKTVVNFVLKEVKIAKTFRGTWQSLQGQALSMKPEMQRAWKWYQVHSNIDLELVPDDIIKYQGIDYRIMTRIDQGGYGYYEYHLVEDFIDAA